MISWRWPRPMAVMASTALMPVSIGSFTGCRCTTVGAWTSSARRSSETISPMPSIGSPSGLTTRPMNASPTGTDRIPTGPGAPPGLLRSGTRRRAVRRRSRARPGSCAMPSRPPLNSSSSLVMALCRPSTRAMPSPVSSTRPTSSRLDPVSNADTFFSIASRIASGEIVSSVIGGSSCSLSR